MKITKDVVEKIAELAKLQIAEGEIEVVMGKMSRVLDLVEEMQAVDTKDVEPMANPLDATQTLRPDTITEHNQRDLFQEIAPNTLDGFYLVPKVVE